MNLNDMPDHNPHSYRAMKWTNEDVKQAEMAAELSLRKVNEAIRLYVEGQDSASYFAATTLEKMPNPHLWNRSKQGVPEIAMRVEAMRGVLQFIVNEAPPSKGIPMQIVHGGAPGMGKRA